MATAQFTLDDLRRILLEAAGVEEGVDLDGDILDTSFAVLGYESIALLETGGLIEREYGVTLDEACLDEDATPADLIAAINLQLTPAAA